MYSQKLKTEIFKNPYFPVSSSIVNKEKYTQILVIPHTHPHIEMMKIIKGPVNVKIGFDNYTCNKGDLIFVPPNVIHEATADTFDKNLVGLVFDAEAFDFRFTNYNFKIMFDNNKIFNYIFTPEHEFYEEINRHFVNAVVRFHNRNDTYKLEVSAHILLLISALVNFYVPDLEKVSNDTFFKIQSALDYINKHYAEKIYTSTLSNILKICDDHFIRMFKEAMHMTPNQFIVNVRIQQAMILLSSTLLPISEIAERVGFSSYAHFCNTFIKKNNITPISYRQKCKMDNGKNNEENYNEFV